MLLHGTMPTKCSMKYPKEITSQLPTKHPTLPMARNLVVAIATATATAATILALSAGAIEVAAPKQPEETLENIPQTFSSVCTPEQKDCKKMYKIQHPKSKKAEKCTSKCASTCMVGGFGSPGEGPFNTTRPLVVFKDGFRSRKYCLSECSDICNITDDYLEKIIYNAKRREERKRETEWRTCKNASQNTSSIVATNKVRLRIGGRNRVNGKAAEAIVKNN